MMRKYKDWTKPSPEEFVKKMNAAKGKGFMGEYVEKVEKVENKQPEKSE